MESSTVFVESHSFRINGIISEVGMGEGDKEAVPQYKEENIYLAVHRYMCSEGILVFTNEKYVKGFIKRLEKLFKDYICIIQETNIILKVRIKDLSRYFILFDVFVDHDYNTILYINIITRT